MKSIWSKIRNQKGTALLTSMLVMGILTSVSLAISVLVVREIGVTRLTLDSGKAYYAAESGVELSLLALENNLPGFQYPGEGVEVELGDSSAVFDIKNRANVYPYFDPEEYDLGSSIVKDNPTVFYDVLDLNESITIPLFIVDEDGIEQEIDKFVVQFYVDFEAGDLKFKEILSERLLVDWDILRWKIHGLNKDTLDTESINDFTAATFTSGGDMTSPSQPSWFGSVNCQEGVDMENDPIECVLYSGERLQTPLQLEDGQYIYNTICLPTEAREYYRHVVDGDIQVEGCWGIDEFLENHNLNYLTLTNMMNPAVFENADWEFRKSKSKLYYRVEVYGNGITRSGDGDVEIVREFADITSTGTSGESTVTLNMKKKRDSYIPVLNFALYHTAE